MHISTVNFFGVVIVSALVGWASSHVFASVTKMSKDSLGPSPSSQNNPAGNPVSAEGQSYERASTNVGRVACDKGLAEGFDLAKQKTQDAHFNDDGALLEQFQSRYINNLPEPALKAALHGLMGHTKADLREVGDVREYAAHLMEIYHERAPTEAQDTPRLTFSYDVNSEGGGPLNPSSKFFSDSTDRIYTWFDRPTDRPVLAKWYQLGDEGDVLLFDRFEMSQSPTEYVWLEPNAGWSRGDYAVEVYDAHTLERLHLGEFMVQ